MVKELVNKNKILSYIKEHKASLKKKIYIAMVVLVAIIAIILVDLIYQRNLKIEKDMKENAYSAEDIKFEPCNDYYVYKFIADYFKARTDLNYPKIFASFGRDYYKEKMDDKKGDIKNIEDTIKYERTFVRNYENIKVYSDKGYRKGDIICIVTYDLVLGFTEDRAPMIIIFYLVKDGDSYVIKDKMDVGTSKYILDCMNTEKVKELYNDVKNRLTKILVSSESLKLAYNSLRQFEMNMNNGVSIDVAPNMDKLAIEKLDPVKDADKICEAITKAKKDKATQEALDAFIKRVVASLSESQRVPLAVGTE